MNIINAECGGLLIPFLKENSYAFENTFKIISGNASNNDIKNKIEESIKNYEVKHGMDLRTIKSKPMFEDIYNQPESLTKLQHRLYNQIIEKWHVPNGTEPFDEKGEVCIFGPKGSGGGKRKTRRNRTKKQITRKRT
jgi:hypothetical protein